MTLLASVAALPESAWNEMDDGCDCTYQRIGSWTNPYLAETLEVRWCCIWKELYKLFPEMVRTTPAYRDGNTGEWVAEPREWDAEFDIPEAIWFRQLAREQGRPIADIRAEYSQRLAEKPKGVARPVAEEAPEPSMLETLLSLMSDMANRLDELEARS